MNKLTVHFTPEAGEAVFSYPTGHETLHESVTLIGRLRVAENVTFLQRAVPLLEQFELWYLGLSKNGTLLTCRANCVKLKGAVYYD